jgi:DNA-binding XRE family transcriptional regulator
MSSHDIPCGSCGAVAAFDLGCPECRVPDDDADAMSPGEIGTWRRKIGVSQAELARLLRVPDSTVSRWERGLMAISSPTILRLALERLADQQRQPS